MSNATKTASDWKRLARDRGEVLHEAVEQMKIWQARAERAEAALPAAKSEWQPIETAPTDGTVIIVWSLLARDSVMAHCIDGEWVTHPGLGYALIPNELTHWMPLPEPPK